MQFITMAARLFRAGRLILSTIFLLFGLCSFTTAHAEPKELRVGVYNFEPLVAITENGSAKGLFIDVLNYVAQQEGWKISYVPGSWNECLSRLMNNEIDLLGSIAFSEERAQKLDFTNEFLFLDWGIVYKKRGSPIQTIFDLEGRRISVLKGSIYTIGFKSMLDQFGIKAILLEQDEFTQVFKSIEDGEAECGINAQVYGLRMEGNYNVEKTQIIFAPVKIRFAVPKGRRQAVLKTLDDYFAKLKADKDSFYYHAFDRWVGLYHKEQHVAQWLKWLLAGICAIALLFVSFSLLLKRQVNRKTAQLVDVISARKLAEAERERLLSAIEQSGEIVVITDVQGTIQYVNPAFEKVTGYTRRQALGVNPRMLKGGHHDQAFYDHLRQTILAGDLWTGRLVNPRKDGTLYTTECSISPIKNEQGTVTNFVWIARDITKELELEKRLAQAQRVEAIGALAGGIAHDFNNLLFPIIGTCEMLLEDLPAGGPQHESVHEIFKAARRAGELVKQILSFSRQAEHEKIPIRIQSILNEAIKLLRATIPSNVDIQQGIPSQCGLVLADPTNLHQIVMNLVTNAFHAVEQSGGWIRIALKEAVLTTDDVAGTGLKPGRYAQLSVADNGHGIDPAVIARIFEPYFTTKKQGKGTGLGLSVVFGIVKEHGGEIRVTSAVGQGTTLSVYLPLLDNGLEVARLETKAVCATGTERILLVDDEEAVVRLLTQLLEKFGYHITGRTSSIAALQAFKADPKAFDLVLSDMTMPNMTGVQLAQELVKIKPDIPIVICSGFSDQMTPDTAKSLGIKGFLMKPVIKSELGQMLRSILDNGNGGPVNGAYSDHRR